MSVMLNLSGSLHEEPHSRPGGLVVSKSSIGGLPKCCSLFGISVRVRKATVVFWELIVGCSEMDTSYGDPASAVRKDRTSMPICGSQFTSIKGLMVSI